MEYIRLNEGNIDKEHICCAMSGTQSVKKKAWLKERFKEGLVFLRSVERGKCFIEYIPAEYAWAPIEAEGYMFINCFWIAGSMKGHGYANDLLNECIADAKGKGMKGLCVLSSAGRKKEFLSDPKHLAYKGFMIADASVNDIVLMYLPFDPEAPKPSFKDCAKKGEIEEKGYVIYYSDQCPFTYYWVPRVKEVMKEHGVEIKSIYVSDREMAQNLPVPCSTYALFKDGRYVTHAIQSDKKLLKIAGIE